jgi:predicted permease
MIPRLRAWLGETHGANFELARHFLLRFFDNDLGATPGSDWQKVAIGILATFLSCSILMVKVFVERYDHFLNPTLSNPALYRHAVHSDILLFIAFAMAMTALLTVLQWQSLFPSLRDSLALAALPVSTRQIFLAKFGVLLLVFTVYLLALAGIPAVLFAIVSGGAWQENPSAMVNIGANFAATAGACVFVFFALLALQGLLLNLLPGRWFARVSLFLQAAIFILTIGGLPLLERQPSAAWWWPSVWFLHLWEAAVGASPGASRTAVLWMTIPACVAVLSYLLSYHRYRPLLLEAPPARPRRLFRGWTGAGAWLLERWIRDPREQAAFAFIWKTLARSRSHRLILLAYAGIALGWIVKGAVDMPRPSLRNEGLYGMTVVLAPLALALLTATGLRYLFSLPVTLPANWMFQTTDREGRASWLAAVERFVVWCALVPIFVASLPASVAILGPFRAVAAGGMAFAAAVLWFEKLFRDWRKLPFTCSYLPGKQPVWATLMRYFFAIPFLGLAGRLILYCSLELSAFIALFTFQVVVWRRWRALRWRNWSTTDLRYEEIPDPDIEALDLYTASRQETAMVSTPAAAQSAPDLFSSGMVASRGILPQSWSEEIRADRRDPAALLQTLLEDIRYGLRLIWRNPLLSTVVILTLTVGIGINASVFTVVNVTILRPHVYKDPDSFLRIFPESMADSDARPVSYAEYIAYRDRNHSLRQLAAFSQFPAMIGTGDSVISAGMTVSCNFFLVDGLDRPILGRLLDAGDCQSRGQTPVAVISAKVWRQHFGSDPAMVGRVIRINSRPVTVVGVAPDRTAGWTRPAGVWIPYTAQAYFDPSRDFFARDEVLWLNLAGRLAPGYTRSQARAEFSILAKQQDRLRPGRYTIITTTNGSWIEEFGLTFSGRSLMLGAIFLGFFYLVLLISCANVATLLLSRAAVRMREIAVRLSLGAPRVRLVRMLVTESLLLASAAGVASVYLTMKLPDPLFHYISSKAPDLPMTPDWRTYAYVAGVVLLAGILSGLAPALESLKVDISGSLKGYSSLFGTTGGTRLRGMLVTAQVAMSMVLLVSAALFAQSEDRALRADPGYLPKRVVVAPVRFPDGTTRESARVRLRAIGDRMRSLPGARAVAYADDIPMLGHDTMELNPPNRSDASLPVDIYAASPGFFETMGIPLMGGREFNETDQSAVVVSQALAIALWRRQNPLGKTLPLPDGTAPVVVGMVRDVEPLRFGGSENPVLYRLHRVDPERNFLAVRFDSSPQQGALAVRSALREMDPNLMVIARVLQDWIDQFTEELWNTVSLILVLGVVATILATTGIYGAVSFAVNQRTREWGIRVALGAQRFDIVREIFRAGGKPVLHGLLVGLWLSVATAAGLGQTVKGSLVSLDTTNPLLYVAAALLLASAAATAMVGPARRGANSDPLDSLRAE